MSSTRGEKQVLPEGRSLALIVKQGQFHAIAVHLSWKLVESTS